MDNLKDILDASYKKPEESNQIFKNLGYTQDPQLSSQKAKVFTDKEGNPNIVFRGTELGRGKKTAIDDIKTDLMIGLGLGKHTKQYKDSMKLKKQVQEKYGKPITAYGYSKGGWQAEAIKADKAITFNKAVGLADIGKTISKTQTDIRTDKDIVSLPSLTQKYRGKTQIIKSKTLNPLESHGLKMLNKLKK